MLHAMNRRKLRATPTGQELALAAITFVWGSTFLIIHNALTVCGPLFFVGARFLVSALTTVPFSLGCLGGLTRREMIAGSMVGVSIFAGYTLQTTGLQTISSSESAFLTALYVPIVPLLQWLMMHRPPRLTSWLGIAMAFAGLLLLAGPTGGWGGFGKGEVLTAIGTIAIAIEIILISMYAENVDVRRVTIVQLAVTA